MKTFSARPQNVRRDWFVVDATDKVLGRLATGIATRLRGKHKAEYTPHIDTGDYIVVVNARHVSVTGRKEEQKVYHRHSGRPGSLKSERIDEVRDRHPERILRHAVKGMLPNTPLGRAMLRKLRIYPGPGHAHAAQLPKPLDI